MHCQGWLGPGTTWANEMNLKTQGKTMGKLQETLLNLYIFPVLNPWHHSFPQAKTAFFWWKAHGISMELSWDFIWTWPWSFHAISMQIFEFSCVSLWGFHGFSKGPWKTHKIPCNSFCYGTLWHSACFAYTPCHYGLLWTLPLTIIQHTINENAGE